MKKHASHWCRWKIWGTCFPWEQNGDNLYCQILEKIFSVILSWNTARFTTNNWLLCILPVQKINNCPYFRTCNCISFKTHWHTLKQTLREEKTRGGTVEGRRLGPPVMTCLLTVHMICNMQQKSIKQLKKVGKNSNPITWNI